MIHRLECIQHTHHFQRMATPFQPSQVGPIAHHSRADFGNLPFDRSFWEDFVACFDLNGLFVCNEGQKL
jgi:hypothetical protein